MSATFEVKCRPDRFYYAGYRKITVLTGFEDLELAQPLLKALTAENYLDPTPIQKQAIPHVLAGRDLLGLAQTGTGKTAAFALPILHKLTIEKKRRTAGAPRALILSPTRELAMQIADNCRKYARFTGVKTMAVFGGMPIRRQINNLKHGTDLLVATPGRLLDLVRSRSLSLEKVEYFVLDEADQMMDLGFIHDMRKLAQILPQPRQTLFFSATMPKAIADLAASFLTDPVEVRVAPVSATADKVDQKLIYVARNQKTALVQQLIKNDNIQKAILFTRTKHGADKVARSLSKDGIECGAIHGNKTQGQRQRTLASFRNGRIRILVATDIAARGIDIDHVSHVFNYDLPDVPEIYVHRIGRTARAGASGQSIALCSGDDRGSLRAVERLMKRSIDVIEEVDGIELAPVPVTDERSRGKSRRGGSGFRGGQKRVNSDGRQRSVRHEDGPGRKRRANRPGKNARRRDRNDTAAGENPAL